jgi:hypothetical protein
MCGALAAGRRTLVSVLLRRSRVLSFEVDQEPGTDRKPAAPDHRAVAAGRIVERGRHAELLAAGGRYGELYRTQFGQ